MLHDSFGRQADHGRFFKPRSVFAFLVILISVKATTVFDVSIDTSVPRSKHVAFSKILVTPSKMRTTALSHLLVLTVWAALSSYAVLVKNAGEAGDIFRGGSQTMTGPIEKRSVLVRDNLKHDRAEENDAVFSAR
ncbi:hypothetical protein BDP55DRAFT_758271 [Colletotrichum godetiae]|uniref:Uncharacterized protein n=1 Tax=Colletotrichum godetiae TaxID=1209918 RepID=A0AAJ0A8V9_9PEZI|nr:uncharacterized protein BDP55DRAFT_758271 [Colletotrichum godetiae]KAK1658655.1 hypothetical protein BDP55DRAFT_758271 [Colletotrichum godetiae]